MKPQISVIIPLYNKESFIKDTIQSVLDQQFRDFEVIVIDDGSEDNSANIVRSFTDDRIRLMKQKNSGVSAARNRGIKEANADLVAFLDADDIWYPQFLVEIISMYNSFPDAVLFFTAYEFKSKNGNIRKAKYQNLDNSNDYVGYMKNYFSSVRKDPPICSSAVAIKKNVFNKLGGFQVGQQLGEDLDMWARVALNFPIVRSSKVCSQYNKEDNQSLTSTEVQADNLIVVKTLLNALKENKSIWPKEKIGDIRSTVGWYYYISSRKHAKSCKYKEAKTAARKAVVYSRGFYKIKVFAWWMFLHTHSSLISRYLKWSTI